MDVQAVTAKATLAPIAAPASVPAVPDLGTDAASDAASAPTATGSPPSHAKGDGSPPATPPTLAGDVTKLFAPNDANYSVAFRVAGGSDQIVVVVTDKATGQTVSQFPSETLIALAQFFNKLDGSVVDKKA